MLNQLDQMILFYMDNESPLRIWQFAIGGAEEEEKEEEEEEKETRTVKSNNPRHSRWGIINNSYKL